MSARGGDAAQPQNGLPAGDDAFRVFICRACGYLYDEALGDPDGGLAPGTRFEDIPDDWMCPTCGVGKADFEPYVTADALAVATPAVQHRTRGGPAPVVIVGAGAAGWAVAAAVRARDATRRIVMITACDGCVYPKPRLSVALAQGVDPAAIVTESGADAARRLGVELLAGTWVSGIDAPRKRVRTTRGGLRYSSLVLAFGATPAPLPLDAASARLVWRINHLDHYKRFRAAVGTQPRRIAMIGAGLVGCELADDLAGAGHAVTLIDLATRPLAALADAATSQRLADALATGGVRFVGGERVAAIRRTVSGLAVDCDRQVVDADLVVAATGLMTDPRLARAAGLAFDRGISVDPATLRSSDPDVFALGDCASFGGRAFRFIEPIHRQAAVIAATMLEHDTAGFEVRTIPVRLKSRSLPLTLQLAA